MPVTLTPDMHARIQMRAVMSASVIHASLALVLIAASGDTPAKIVVTLAALVTLVATVPLSIRLHTKVWRGVLAAKHLDQLTHELDRERIRSVARSLDVLTPKVKDYGWEPTPFAVAAADRELLLAFAVAANTEDLRVALSALPQAAAQREQAERQAAIDAYEDHISNPNWRAAPAREWMLREAELRSQLPDGYDLPDGVAR